MKRGSLAELISVSLLGIFPAIAAMESVRATVSSSEGEKLVGSSMKIVGMGPMYVDHLEILASASRVPIRTEGAVSALRAGILSS